MALPGCAMCRSWGTVDAYGPQAPCHLSAETPLPALVQHLNQNTSRLSAWRATGGQIQIHAPGALPIPAKAMIAVEAPRNFRIIVSGPVGNEADFGSNADQFWFWLKRNEPRRVFMARHDQIGRALRRFPIPIQPEWLMEVLGVVPIDEGDITLELPPPGVMQPPPVGPLRRLFGQRPPPAPIVERRALLVSQRFSPQGEPLRKVIVVDLCHGTVLEHSLYDGTGQLIARAVLSGHYTEATSGAVLANHLSLEWPRERTTISLTLNQVQVNPQLPAQLWTLPTIPDSPVLDLGE